MSAEPFIRYVEVARQRLDALQRRDGDSPASQIVRAEDALDAALEELSTAVEELQVAVERLRSQDEELIAARQALEAERRRYHELFEFAPDGYLMTDAAGTILEANRAAATLLHMDQDALVGKPLSLFVVPEERRTFQRRLMRLRRGSIARTQSWQFRMGRREEALFHTAVTVAAMLDNEGWVVDLRWLLHDISEQVRSEEALQLYAERLKRLHEIDQAVLAASSPEAIAQAALPNIERLVPCQWGCIVAFDFDAHEATVLAAHDGWETGPTAGARVPLELFGDLDALRQDRVDRVADIQSLSEPLPILQALHADDLCAYVNVPLVARDKLIGCLTLGARRPGTFTIEHLDIAREVADSLALAIQPALLHAQAQGSVAEREPRVTERMATLRETDTEPQGFSYSLLHELRAPLRAMQGFGQALLEDYADRLDAIGQDYAQRIVGAAQHMDTLFQNLLIYGRLSRNRLPRLSVQLADVMEEALTSHARAIAEHEAQIALEEPLPAVIGHHATLVQVMTQLLTNALTFVAPDVAPRVRIWAETRGEWVRLWVEDNGPGIAPEDQGRIFGILERLHGIETYPGTGIGLAIVRKGVQQMGGQVGVESAVGQGSKFWIELRKSGP